MDRQSLMAEFKALRTSLEGLQGADLAESGLELGMLTGRVDAALKALRKLPEEEHDAFREDVRAIEAATKSVLQWIESQKDAIAVKRQELYSEKSEQNTHSKAAAAYRRR